MSSGYIDPNEERERALLAAWRALDRHQEYVNGALVLKTSYGVWLFWQNELDVHAARATAGAGRGRADAVGGGGHGPPDQVQP
jgi:hypothetical protein